jgi:hypothetical protein
LTRNIRERRGSKVNIVVPAFKDRSTQIESIHMDSMAFGMGSSCLQCTFQCCNIDEARQFYDQLAVTSPIFLALTASAPLWRVSAFFFFIYCLFHSIRSIRSIRSIDETRDSYLTSIVVGTLFPLLLTIALKKSVASRSERALAF